jgi:hypothetical protein
VGHFSVKYTPRDGTLGKVAMHVTLDGELIALAPFLFDIEKCMQSILMLKFCCLVSCFVVLFVSCFGLVSPFRARRRSYAVPRDCAQGGTQRESHRLPEGLPGGVLQPHGRACQTGLRRQFIKAKFFFFFFFFVFW